ncbi:unnamed protein product [Rotaria socialis]|uniref:RING-type E3 ubiquitin transferase n=1 Tax=Rotaria socialis TaxID=392032 RepID=A0A818FLQ1_9BILA|nr:unnamed protein product [Rotaria socialis]CAF3475939.1 unnamed protein product [Rotaria socialis]CAF3635313.1 unnamed protein product [Rotaria socialis]CAF3699266.1 unnamed protein product [Rotaria socialis]CAF3720149.1 unnamed protein product [Rotaria socialis]
MASIEETSADNSNIPPPSSGNDDDKKSSTNNDKDSGFECNICLETARDAVLSLCGHLFCWPCIHQWLETRAHNPTCPVCKSGISREKLVPIYGRNSPQTDPRNTTPPRPAGTRQEPRRNRSFGFGDGVNFQMSFGVGAFPFGLFQTTFATNNHDHQYTPPPPGTPERYHHDMLSRIFLGIALAVILFIIFN